MNSVRLTPALLATIVTALVTFWVCFAVVASATRTTVPLAVSVEQPRREATGPVGTTVTLSPMSALRVRATLLERSPVRPRLSRRKHRTRTRTTAIDMAATPEPVPAMSDPPARAATPEPIPTQPTPSPRPAPPPRPTLTAAPKQAATPDFDQSQPSGFDTSG